MEDEAGSGGGEGGEGTGAAAGAAEGASLAPRRAAAPAGPEGKAPAAGDPGKKGADKGTPPTRPDYVPEKFWDGQGNKLNDEALARSYTALEKRLGSFVGAPAADKDGKVPYELKTSDPNVQGILVPDSPHWEAAKEFFAKHNCSQEFVSECLTLQGQIFGAQNATTRAQEDARLRAEGYNDVRMEQFADRWAGLVGDETYDRMANEFFRSAEGVLFFDRVLWPMVSGGKMPTDLNGDTGAQGRAAASLSDLYAARDKARGPEREEIEKKIRETSRQLAGE
jgi:hypothetical protein